MTSTQFPRPVTILAGVDGPRRICSVLDAYAMLSGSSGLSHDEAFEAAISTCQMAMVGTATAEEANDIFAAYARRAGLLIEDPAPEEIASTSSDVPA